MKQKKFLIIIIVTVFFITGCSLNYTKSVNENTDNSNSTVTKEILNDNQDSKMQKTYRSQQECEAETKKGCDFVMCDYIPDDMTPEEICGIDSKGWIPIK